MCEFGLVTNSDFLHIHSVYWIESIFRIIHITSIAFQWFRWEITSLTNTRVSNDLVTGSNVHMFFDSLRKWPHFDWVGSVETCDHGLKWWIVPRGSHFFPWNYSRLIKSCKKLSISDLTISENTSVILKLFAECCACVWTFFTFSTKVHFLFTIDFRKKSKNRFGIFRLFFNE